jgi:hypothetical protein
MDFLPLNVPLAKLKLTRISGKVKVICLVRMKSVVLTPEEWVRQHILNFLIIHAGYPKGMIAVEFALKYNGGTKRCDILVLNELGAPLMIIECKAPNVKVNKETFYQISKYDNPLNASCLLITNGIKHFTFLKSKTDGNVVLREGILSWLEVNAL